MFKLYFSNAINSFRILWSKIRYYTLDTNKNNLKTEACFNTMLYFICISSLPVTTYKIIQNITEFVNFYK